MMARRQLLMIAPAALAACAAPRINNYRLAAVPGVTIPTPPVTVGIRPIAVPGYLDQSGVLEPGTAYQTATYQNELWAEPLADILRDVMVRELGQRLQAATVLGSGGAIAAPVDLTVEINILRFDRDASNLVTLSAQFALRSSAGGMRSAVQAIDLSTSATAAGAAGTVAAMSGLWGGAADLIGRGIAARAMPQSG